MDRAAVDPLAAQYCAGHVLDGQFAKTTTEVSVAQQKSSRRKTVGNWAWMTDANKLKDLEPAALADALDVLMPLQTDAVRDYVQQFDVFDKTVLVGPKGSGKTFLLWAKSYFARRAHNQVGEDARHFYPPDTLVERIEGGGSLQEIVQGRHSVWKDPKKWRDAWAMALSAIAFETALLRKQLDEVQRKQLNAYYPGLFHTDEDGCQTTKRRHSATFYLQQTVLALGAKESSAIVRKIHAEIIAPGLRQYGPLSGGENR